MISSILAIVLILILFICMLKPYKAYANYNQPDSH